MATNTFQIVITQTGAQQTAQAISQVGAAAQKSANIMGLFRQALVLASTVRAAAGLVDLIDTATRIDNRLRVATNSAQDFARAQQFVATISRQTRTELESNAVTYGRLLKSTESLGYSSQFLEKVMTGLALSVKVGGATSQEARNAMIQFSQSLASGALRGDELRSVAEQLPALATAIGREFGISGGQIIAFAKANPGILETERVVKAVAAAVPELTEQAKKMTPTLTEGFIAIRNAAITMLGEINRGTGLFGAFSRGLVLIADNLNIVVELAAAFIALRYGATIAAWSGAIATFGQNLGAMLQLMVRGNGIMASFSAMFMVNPITVWIAAIAAAVVALTALYNYFPQVKAAVDGFFGTVATLVDVLYKVITAIGQSLPSWVTMDGTMKIVANTVALLVQAFSNIITFALVPFVTLAEVVVRALNAIGFASAETVNAVAGARQELYAYAQGLLTGKTASVDAAQATEVLTDRTKGLLAPLLGAKGGTDAAKIAAASLAEEVKRVDEGYRIAGERLGGFASTIPSSVEGFNNLARVTKDWEKYTTDANTAVTGTKAAAAAAKPPTDALAGSMGAVNRQASGAASSANSMAASLQSSAKSSATTVEQVTEMVKGFGILNPLMLAAAQAAEADAKGFAAAGQAAANATSGVYQLVQAYKDLAAAKAAAGSSSGSDTGGTSGGARAAGGPVVSGNTYLVGEKGPELFTPNSNGNIIPNHVLTGSSGGAANDNMAPLVKAINRMANAIMVSNQAAVAITNAVITEVQTQTENTAKALQRAAVDVSQSKSFKGSGWQSPTGFKDWKGAGFLYGMGEWPGWVGYGVGNDRFGNRQFTTPEKYAEYIRANKILPGDAEYRSNTVSRYENYGKAGAYVSFDANSPYASEIASLQAKLALAQAAYERYKDVASGIELRQMLYAIKSYQESIQQYTAKQDAAIEYLKGARDAEANFQQFKDAIPAMMAEASKTQDFQTLTPWEGGKQYGMSDPYGIGNAPRPDDAAVQGKAVTNNISNDNRVQVQMTVNTPNSESFRHNRAQIEGAIASMVDRANRRAGRK